MTRIVFDLESVVRAGEQGGAVTFRAPEFRKGEDGTIITTYKERINLADTPGFVDVHPGPIEVELIAPHDAGCLRVEFNVPDVEEISLAEFLHGGELLDPQTVNDVKSLLAEFRTSGEAAIAAGDKAVQAAAEAKSARQIIDQYREQVTTARGEVLAARDAAAASAAAAKTSETNAKTSETNAASSKTAAASSASSASSSAASATASKTAAATSATNAANSAAAAATSVTTASQKASDAAAQADRASSEAARAESDRQEVEQARQIIGGYRLEVTGVRDQVQEWMQIADVYAGQAQQSAQTASAKAGEASDSAAAAKQSETNAATSAQTATTQAERATSEADRAGQAAADSSVKAVADKVNEILAGAPEAYDTLREIAAELERGQSAEAALTQAIAGKAPLEHTHTAAQISDATATGRSVLTAASQAAARTAIGAGTSNLTLGTTSTTAAAGNHTHTASQVGAAPATHTHTMSQVTDLPALETPTREASDRANKLAVRDSQGRLLSQNYASASAVLAMEQELPHTLASLWAARQIAADVVNARTPKIVEVAALPASPDPSTVYLVTG